MLYRCCISSSDSRGFYDSMSSPTDTSLLHPNWSQDGGIIQLDSRSPSPANTSDEETVKLKPGIK